MTITAIAGTRRFLLALLFLFSSLPALSAVDGMEGELPPVGVLQLIGEGRVQFSPFTRIRFLDSEVQRRDGQQVCETSRYLPIKVSSKIGGLSRIKVVAVGKVSGQALLLADLKYPGSPKIGFVSLTMPFDLSALQGEDFRVWVFWHSDGGLYADHKDGVCRLEGSLR